MLLQDFPAQHQVLNSLNLEIFAICWDSRRPTVKLLVTGRPNMINASSPRCSQLCTAKPHLCSPSILDITLYPYIVSRDISPIIGQDLQNFLPSFSDNAQNSLPSNSSGSSSIIATPISLISAPFFSNDLTRFALPLWEAIINALLPFTSAPHAVSSAGI